MLSIMIPVLNESESLAQLYSEIVQNCEKEQLEFEILFINDGSTDDSWKIISDLAERDERVSGVSFRRNFGKASALTVAMRTTEANLRKACLAYADRAGMWGVNPDILRRELKLRGYYGV